MALAIPPKLYWNKENYPTFIESYKNGGACYKKGNLNKQKLIQSKTNAPKITRSKGIYGCGGS